MSKLSFNVMVVIGKIFRLFHKKQFKNNTVFYGIPKIIRCDRLRCGEGLKVNGNVHINADGSVIIGKNVTLSYGVTILAASYDTDVFFRGERVHKNTGIKIGNNVWVGANTTILDGVVICDHVIIGAGSVVVKNIYEPYSIYAGNPARLIKRYEKQ